MSFLELIWRNVTTRKIRSSLTAVAVAIAIMTVVTLGVLTHSLRQTAISILKTGSADFTIAQKGVTDVINSAIDEPTMAQIAQYKGVADIVSVLVANVKLDDNHPLFLELGIPTDKLGSFGVQLLDGRAYAPNSDTEMMLGWRAARDLHKNVGDTVYFPSDNFTGTVVGIYTVNNVFGDSASMFPLSNLQGRERKPGDVTLGFVKVAPGTDIDALRSQIEHDFPELATVRTESEFGRVDRNLNLISAANVGVSIMALAIGAIGVWNTMMMSVFERTREFGVLRAVGWSRRRVLALVYAEAVAIALIGAMLGCLLGWVAVVGIQGAPELVGVFEPDFTSGVFGRALGIAVGMAFVGAFFPAIRAAFLSPLEALRHE